MGTVLASKIIADAAELVLDPDYDRNDATNDWLKWLNAGQNEIALLKPDVSVRNAVVIQVAGTKQSLAEDDISLIKLTRNMGTDGLTPGPVIDLVDEKKLNLRNPDWNSDTANAEAVCYIYDVLDPNNYYIYPPQPSSSQGYIERVTSIIPAEIPTISDSINIPDIYENHLLNYIMYRATLINALNSPYAKAESTNYYNALVTGLGRKDLVEVESSPSKKD